MSGPTRPVLRYHGGKWRLAPWIISHFPQHRVYTEAFGGGASVLMQKARAHTECYNDLDHEIVNVFDVLRNGPLARELEEQLRLTPYSRFEFERAYEESSDPVEQARRTLVRSAMGFGTALTRYNRNGTPQRTGFRANAVKSGTHPARDWHNFADCIPLFRDRLAGVLVENAPAIDVLARFDKEWTLHYVDPPYPHSTRGADAGGTVRAYRHEMTDADHKELALSLHYARGMVIVSGYACDLYDKELYSDWYRVEKPTHGDGARDRVEVLWLNPLCQKRLAQKEMMFADGAA